jgi:hypothetical protein
MNSSFHFISGLQRSVATVLSAILRQDQRFHEGMSSPVASICDDLFERYSKLAFWRDMPTSKVFRIVAQADGNHQQAMPQPTQRLDG